MADLSNQEFYELTPSGAPEEQPKPKIKRGALIMVGVGAVIAIGAAAVGIIFYNQAQDRQAQERETVSVIEVANGHMTEETAECVDALDPQACEDRARRKIARELGLVDFCAELDGQRLYNCVTTVAREQLDPEKCQLLTDQERRDCEDSVYIALAQDETDLGICDQIHNEADAESCRSLITNRIIDLNACAEYGIDESLCQEEQEIYQAALNNECALLSDTAKSMCEEYLGSLDQDSDGLRLSAEHEAGTSDQNPDTDGDGYSDFDEVINGFDPLN